MKEEQKEEEEAGDGDGAPDWREKCGWWALAQIRVPAWTTQPARHTFFLPNAQSFPSDPVLIPGTFASTTLPAGRSRSRQSSFAGAHVFRQQWAPLVKSAPPHQLGQACRWTPHHPPAAGSQPEPAPCSAPLHSPEELRPHLNFPWTPSPPALRLPYKNHPRSHTRLDFLSADHSRLHRPQPAAHPKKTKSSCKLLPAGLLHEATRRAPQVPNHPVGSRELKLTSLRLWCSTATLACPRSHANRFVDCCCSVRLHSLRATPTRQQQGPALFSFGALHH